MTERTLLLRNATLVATMDDGRREIPGGGVYIRGNAIAAVDRSDALPDSADEVIDLAHHVVLPGLVNTHHHLFQSLTRALPAAQDAELFAWLSALYPVWARLTPEMLRVSALTGLAELALSGCTTSSDHLYLYPNGGRLDDTIDAARAIGLRFHACRGAMSMGESQGGLPPDALVEAEDAILRDTRRVIESFHDAARYAMLRVAVAPCSMGWDERARAVGAAFSKQIAASPMAHTYSLVGADFLIGPTLELVVSGRPDAPDVAAMRRSSTRAFCRHW
jgi:cytosine/adenosine deaminase-related metal-dependent hydrolase